MPTSLPIVLDLCGGTGAWSQPWANAGYEVIIVDPAAPLGMGHHAVHVEDFAASYRHSKYSFGDVVGIMAAPPCTEFASSGARWWKEKTERDCGLLARAILTVTAVEDIIKTARIAGHLKWWVIENPVGRIARCMDWDKPKLIFNPCDYAGWARDPRTDSYTKRTCLWGDFNVPVKDTRKITHPKGKSPIHTAPDSKGRWRRRSITPEGFARAFYWANGVGYP
jgi:site-specific DNA-cytosine methylase